MLTKSSRGSVFGILAGLVASASFLQAQSPGPAERVFARDGVTCAVQGVTTNQLDQPLDLPENITVATNATFRVHNGRERTLLPGQVLSADGCLTSPDGSIEPVFDHIAMVKGAVVVCRDGLKSTLQESLVLGDGSIVSPAGMYDHQGAGGFLFLLDGQMFRLDGRPIPVKDTITLRAGKVQVQKDGSSFEVTPGRSLMMNDGTKVFGDGSVVSPDGSTRQLLEGEILVVPGVVHRFGASSSAY
jgi:hypothetical protein